MRRQSKRLLGLTVGLGAGYLSAQVAWLVAVLAGIDVRESLRADPNRFPEGMVDLREEQGDGYVVRRAVERGIERVSYTPLEPEHETPLLMMHGMWHAAWCWEPWQELFARWGWASHAFSLPGHGASPEQRPLARCTLDYYLAFLRQEVQRLPHRPVLMGHSMGGALVEWYLKYVGQDLPAAVLLAAWPSHSLLLDGVPNVLRLDASILLRMMIDWDARSFVRSPQAAARALLGPQAVVSPEDLYRRLGSESALVLFQHNPPFWSPPRQVSLPILWVAAQRDRLISESAQRKSARYYGADYALVPGAGHNLMMEARHADIAERIQRWFQEQGVP